VEDEALAAWCDAMAVLLDLPVKAGDRTEIIANLRVIARQMKLVGEFPLEDRAEPAPVFRA
jgi:hypothetical protein